ncbi:4f77f2eb-8825-449f-ad3f-0b487ff4e79b [Thermothielavioides terrestris]|uniref:4f77f2eb-8825-449f-ad3f-0b487ff4e79b n=1 Tax=Thermothielavioides terrestris TaxID=2587410 RepID=A0A446BHT4_9PEZI|nr:4f77f2eb-8825-449f-ad3f-0b487ff4e79b [Thermothielavioides terrestris]
MSAEQTPLLSGTERRDAAATSPSDPIDRVLGAGGGRLPLNIGHRGYNAAFPENTMAAFQGAVAAGAHAIETDLHLSRDGVVVLSHDATLKRCYGTPERIADCDWAHLRTLRTLREPRQPMARLVDLLTWLASGEEEEEGKEGKASSSSLSSVWVLLDVKMDDDPGELYGAIARVIDSVAVPAGTRPWKERIVVGGWNEHFLHHARVHLPGYALAYTGGSLLYAARFLSDAHPDVHFNLRQQTLVGPVGAAFRRAVRKRGRKLFVWTVNEPLWMEWSIKKGVDGVITDQVARYASVRDKWGGDGDGEKADGVGKASSTLARTRRGSDEDWQLVVKLYVQAFVWQGLAVLITIYFWRMLNTRGMPGKGGRQPNAKPQAVKA